MLSILRIYLTEVLDNIFYFIFIWTLCWTQIPIKNNPHFFFFFFLQWMTTPSHLMCLYSHVPILGTWFFHLSSTVSWLMALLWHVQLHMVLLADWNVSTTCFLTSDLFNWNWGEVKIQELVVLKPIVLSVHINLNVWIPLRNDLISVFQ